MSAKQRWYESWFDTPYYHKLYNYRDDNEARFFIRNLIDKLAVPPCSRFLDLACGRGRHARFLRKMGFDVTGVDLSEKNIKYADRFGDEHLRFEVGDMRESLGVNKYDYIFNLFTSFGYFNDRKDNQRAAKAMSRALKPRGVLILDFMNVHKVELGLVGKEVCESGGIKFHIERTIRDNKVIKNITFVDGTKNFQFEEEVQLLSLKDFKKLFYNCGLQIENTYGDFSLNPYDDRNSERLILFASQQHD